MHDIMAELRNLQKLGALAGGRFDQYCGNDFVLPKIVKDKVKNING